MKHNFEGAPPLGVLHNVFRVWLNQTISFASRLSSAGSSSRLHCKLWRPKTNGSRGRPPPRPGGAGV